MSERMKAQSDVFLFDTHAHLASSKFAEDLDAVVTRAREAGVSRIVTIACDLEDSAENLALARRFEGVFPTAGIHPLYVHEPGHSEEWKSELRQLASSGQFVAIGEIGLDYFHPPQDGGSEADWRGLQREFFEAQLSLAGELGLPAVIHQRESADDVMAVLRNFPDVRAVLHCFNGSRDQAEAALEMGLFLSFTGILTFPKAEEVREVAAACPLDRIMVETDCPYLAPVPYRGKRCEPHMVSHTAETLGTLHGLSLPEIADATTGNAQKFFHGLPSL